MTEETRAAPVAAGYFRVSKARDGMQAPEIYQDQIERYCAYKGLVLGEVFSDIDHSGYKKSRRRPELAKLVEGRAAYSAIVVPKLSRFGRNLTHLAELFEMFDREKIALVFLDLGLDTSSSQGRLLRNIMASIAEYESDIKSDYSRANARHMASQGRSWGSPPYGYRYEKKEKNLFLDEVEAPIVSEIFRRFVAGDSMGSILVWLRDDGIPTRRGGVWAMNTLARMLDNPSYVGLRPFDGQLIEATWEPLVDGETWERAVTRRSQIKAEHTRSTPEQRKVNYLMRGVMECGECGRRLVHRPMRGTQSGCYVCPHSGHFSRTCSGGGIASARAEELVIKALRNRLWFAFAHDLRLRQSRLADLEDRWSRGGIDERRDLIKLAMAEIVLLPRDSGVSPGSTLGRARRLKIRWADGWEGLVGEPEEIIPRDEPGVTRWCSGCGMEHPLGAFNRDGSKWDGYQRQCRTCILAKRRARRANIPRTEAAMLPGPKPRGRS